MDGIRHLQPNMEEQGSGSIPSTVAKARYWTEFAISNMVPTLSINEEEQGNGSASWRNIDSLPDDMLFEILLRLTAEDISEKARFVCRRWNRLIHGNGNGFIDAHLHHTSSGLLLSREGNREHLFVTAAQGQIEISKLSHYTRRPTPASCNGLLLDVRMTNFNFFTTSDNLFILNPATNCTLRHLPPLDRSSIVPLGIAYAAASIKYKVVATYIGREEFTLVDCYILTVGVDKSWRRVAVDKLSLERNEVLPSYPFLTQGFLCWTSPMERIVLTLNVETEVMTETHVPPLLHPGSSPRQCGFLGFDYYYMTTGKHLSLLILRKDYVWDVWEMKPQTGEWRKLPLEINLEAHRSTVQYLGITSIYWVKYPEFLAIFPWHTDRHSSFIVYNLATHEIDSIELPTLACRYQVVAHRRSLVRLI